VYCFHCMLYTNAIHFCLEHKKWINVDRFNRIIIYADTENGAISKHANDHCGASVVSMKKFAIDNREEIIIDRKAEEAKREKHEREAQETQELSWMMGKIFGEFQTYNIGNELNKHLDKDHDRAFTWSDKELQDILGYHTNNDGLMINDYPKEKLSKEQQMRFGDLRRNETIRSKYNALIEEKKKQQDKQLEQERRQRQDRELRRQDMVLGFYR
jgi:hypothetical protein